MLTRAAHDDRGFLLVEAIVAMALLSIAFALFAEFASMMTNRNATLSRQAYLSSQARAALDTFSDDIEGGVCNGTGSSGTQPITNATTTSITFYSADRQSPYHLRADHLHAHERRPLQAAGSEYEHLRVRRHLVDGPDEQGGPPGRLGQEHDALPLLLVGLRSSPPDGQ